MNDNTSATPSEPLFLSIPVARLILLSIASCGLYEVYWIYRNWRFLKERKGLNIRPFWRGIFGIFFCHSLLRDIHADRESRTLLEPAFSASGLATGWVILLILANLIGRIPGAIASIISFVMPSYLFFAPVQNYINSVTEMQFGRPSYYRWSSGHIVCLIFGIIIWASVISIGL